MFDEGARSGATDHHLPHAARDVLVPAGGPSSRPARGGASHRGRTNGVVGRSTHHHRQADGVLAGSDPPVHWTTQQIADSILPAFSWLLAADLVESTLP